MTDVQVDELAGGWLRVTTHYEASDGEDVWLVVRTLSDDPRNVAVDRAVARLDRMAEDFERVKADGHWPLPPGHPYLDRSEP